MGIHLDWEVESDLGREEVSEDAAVVAARERKRKWNRRALIAAAVLLIIGGIAAAWRIREVRAALREALDATVESEALALRLGDKRKFMALQGPAEEWRVKQREAFDLFQRAALTINVTGDILDVQMGSDEARVTVEVLVNEQPQTAVWLYEYTDKGWKHVATESEPWSMIEEEGEWYTLAYFPADGELAKHVKAYLDVWWAQAFEATDYKGELPPLTVKIDPDAPQRIVWDGDDHSMLRIPTLYAENGEIALLTGELRSFAAEYWTFAVYQEKMNSMRWLEAETQVWFAEMFMEGHGEAYIFASLTEAFGDELMKDFFRIKRENKDMVATEALREAMTQNAPGDLQGDELLRYLTAYLRAEAYTEAANDEPVGRWQSRVGQVFMDEYISGDSVDGFYVTNDAADPYSLEVISVERVGDILWARVRYVPVWDHLQVAVDTYVPFRFVDGYWAHTWVRYSDSGGAFVLRGSTITLVYDEANSTLIDDGLVSALETAHAEAVRLFGAESIPMTFVIQSNAYVNLRLDEQNAIYLPSPYWNCCIPTTQSSNDYLRETAIQEVINMLYLRTVGDTTIAYGYNPIDWAMIDVARAKAGLLPTDFLYGQQVVFVEGAIMPTSVTSLWGSDTGWYDDRTRFESYARMVGARALIEALIEQYGEDVMPLLVSARINTYSTDQWLIAALRITAADIDPAWQARFMAMMDAEFPMMLIPVETP